MQIALGLIIGFIAGVFAGQIVKIQIGDGGSDDFTVAIQDRIVHQSDI